VFASNYTYPQLPIEFTSKHGSP